MENEKGNGYGAGEGQGPDYHTDNREPVIVAEQPAQEVTGDFEQASGGQDAADRGMPGQSGPERGTAGWGTAGQNCAIQDGSDGWRSPMDAPSREDRWSDTGDKPYLGSPWEPTQSGTAYDAGKNNGASGNDSQPVYKPAPASYGQGQPGAGQSGSGGRDSGFSQNDSRQERGSGQPGGSSQYQTQYQTQYQSYPPVYQEKNNMATASLVMGILSLCSICCCMLFGIVFGVLGIIFAIMSKKGDRMDGQAKAGLILSIIGIAVTVLVIIFFVAIEVFTVIPELN
ncbi:DUF4190 domain-containing protein [Enterocloster clostridioformis]|uniref:DUF4190 domain-containing protein n=1 Tax=Enterocloster clostridioformis TaxID=1531 RepID=UPI0004262B7D|nr:DUF4190 domain-containing protein [Enterocloster clostridioformis]